MSHRRTFDEAFEREQENQRAHALRRQNMTIGARRRERTLIRERMLECGERNLVDDAALRDELISEGKLPYVDPISLDDGIDLVDVVRFRMDCVSRAAMLRYLDVNRDEGQPPRMYDGIAITADEVRTVFGLDPSTYSFFNQEFPRVNGVPLIDPNDELLARNIAAEEAEAISDVSRVWTDAQFRDTFVRGHVMPSSFQEALTTPSLFGIPGHAPVLRLFHADQEQTIFELTRAYERLPNTHDDVGRQFVEREILTTKVNFLLREWRSNDGSRYNVFLNGNREVLNLLNVNYRQSISVLQRVFLYVRSSYAPTGSLQRNERFVNWTREQTGRAHDIDLIGSVRIMRTMRDDTNLRAEQREQLQTLADRLEFLVVQPNTPNFAPAMVAFDRAIVLQFNAITLRLMNMAVPSFMDHFPLPLADGTFDERVIAEFELTIIDPFVFDGRRRYVYDAENENLLFEIINNPPNGDNNLKVARLLESYNTKDVSGVHTRCYNIGLRDFIVVRRLIAIGQPAMLSIILKINEVNAGRGHAQYAYAMATPAHKETIRQSIGLVSNARARLEFEFLFDRYFRHAGERLGLREPTEIRRAVSLPPTEVNSEDEARQIEFLEGFDEFGQ